jgi:hypothetical protein
VFFVMGAVFHAGEHVGFDQIIGFLLHNFTCLVK